MKMLAAILMSLLPTSTASATCVLPRIFGTIPNNDKGEIMFLTTYENCPDPQPGRDVLGIGGRGKTIKGCWVLKDDDFIVEWNDGETYVYGFSGFTMTEEADEFTQCKDRARDKGQKS